jgi:hypothetical protein
VNLGIQKRFQLGERVGAALGADFNNVFNHPLVASTDTSFANLLNGVVAAAQARRILTNVRQIDFRNFVYPWRDRSGVPPRLQWLSEFAANVNLHDGVHVFANEECGPFHRCPAVSLGEVVYADVDRNSVQDAIIVLNYRSGGTAHWQYVYLYTVEGGAPKLLAAFETGSRIYQGLHRVHAGNGRLIVELNDPESNEGDCCATWRTRTEYQWRDGHFEIASKPVREPIPVHQRTWYVAG